MTPTENGGSAFPQTCLNDPCHPFSSPGMALRDWFAGQALAGVVRQCANDGVLGFPEGVSSIEELFARNSYRIADAMLKARENTNVQS